MKLDGLVNHGAKKEVQYVRYGKKMHRRNQKNIYSQRITNTYLGNLGQFTQPHSMYQGKSSYNQYQIKGSNLNNEWTNNS